MIHFQCKKCQSSYRVSDDKAGVKSRCKKCGEVFTVPDASNAPPPVSTSDGEQSASVAPVASATSTNQTTNQTSLPPRPRAAPSPSQAGSKHPTAKTYTSVDSFTSDAARTMALRGRPFEPEREVKRRFAALMILGSMLIAGFLLPVFGAGPRGDFRMEFVNLTALNQSPNVMATVMMLYPIIAGILLLVIASSVEGPMRGVAMVFLGLVPVVYGVIEAVNSGVLRGFAIVPQGSILIAMIMLIGLYGVFIGNRARWYRPDCKPAYVFALIGGCCLLVVLMAPLGEKPVFIEVFSALQGNIALGIGIIIPIYMMIAAGVISVINSHAKPLPTASNLGGWAFRLLLGSWVIGFIVFLALQFMVQGLEVLELITVFSIALKGICWAGGILLLLPLGVTDMLIGNPALDFNACVKCGYDLRANADRLCPECGTQNPT